MTHIIEFNTARLRLRQWKESDREAFARLNANPRVMAFFPNLLDRQTSDAIFDDLRSQIAERGWGLWAVEVLQAEALQHEALQPEALQKGECIGFVGLYIPSPDLPCSPCVEISWRLLPEYWGKGYATEAARAVLQVAFETVRLPEIVSFTSLPNLPSKAVMERIGMLQDGEFEHPHIPPGHPLRSHVLYRLPYEQWLDQTADSACDK